MSDTIASREHLSRVLSELTTEQRRLADEGRELRENLSKKVEDLTAATRAVQEAQQAEARRAQEPSGAERDLGAYVVADDKTRALEPSAYRGQVQMTAAIVDGVHRYGLLDDPAPRCQIQRDLQQLVADRALVRASMRDPRPGVAPATPYLDGQIARIMAAMPRRIFTDAAGVGAEWIPDITLASLEREVTLPRAVVGLFQQVPIGPGGTIKQPFLSRGVRPYLSGVQTVDDPAQITASTPATAEREWAAKMHSVRVPMDVAATEDSIIPALPELRRLVVEALADATEDCILNGDTTATHQDAIASWDIRGRWGSTGLGSSIDHRRAWIGLRARAADISNQTDQGSAQTAAGFAAARAKLTGAHAFGGVVAITSPEYLLLKLLTLDEVETVGNFGPGATILTGQLASLYGVPLILSEFMGADLNASGVYDNSTKTKTGMVLVNRDRFRYGVRRGAMIEIDKDITRQVVNLVATARHIFYTFDSATAKNVHYSYNLSAS